MGIARQHQFQGFQHGRRDEGPRLNSGRGIEGMEHPVVASYDDDLGSILASFVEPARSAVSLRLKVFVWRTDNNRIGMEDVSQFPEPLLISGPGFAIIGVERIDSTDMFDEVCPVRIRGNVKIGVCYIIVGKLRQGIILESIYSS